MTILYDQKGYVFWAVLAVLLAISLLLLNVTSTGVWHRSQNRNALYRTQAQYLAHAAVEHTLWYLNEWTVDQIPSKEFVLIDSLDQSQSWSSHVSPWGCYLRSSCTGRSHHKTVTYDLLFGIDPHGTFDPAITLFGPPYPLIIAGDAEITGNVANRSAGISAGEYNGRGPADSSFLNNVQVLEQSVFAEPMPDEGFQGFRTMLENMRTRAQHATDRTAILDDNLSFDDLDSILSFGSALILKRAVPIRPKRPFYIFAQGPIVMAGHSSIHGRIVFCSQHSITLEGQADLSGAILIAPKIIIRNRAQFSGQAIAGSSLVLSENCQTIFPCLLSVTGDVGNVAAPILRIGSKQLCEGIACFGTEVRNLSKPVARRFSGIVLERGSTWRGYLYSSAAAEVHGVLHGALSAETLYFKDGPTTYLNWLVDANVHRYAWMGIATLPIQFARSGHYRIAEICNLD